VEIYKQAAQPFGENLQKRSCENHDQRKDTLMTAYEKKNLSQQKISEKVSTKSRGRERGGC